MLLGIEKNDAITKDHCGQTPLFMLPFPDMEILQKQSSSMLLLIQIWEISMVQRHYQ
jgi:hypothetical protein